MVELSELHVTEFGRLSNIEVYLPIHKTMAKIWNRNEIPKFVVPKYHCDTYHKLWKSRVHIYNNHEVAGADCLLSR